MKVLRILDSNGDTSIAFDETTATDAQRADAKVVFNDFIARQKGTAILTQRPEGAADVKITAFDQIEDGAEALLIKPIVGG